MNKPNNKQPGQKKLIKALCSDLEEASDMFIFLSEHLAGRMGRGALDDMVFKAQEFRRTVAKAKRETG